MAETSRTSFTNASEVQAVSGTQISGVDELDGARLNNMI
jgi:hypothetical protein